MSISIIGVLFVFAGVISGLQIVYDFLHGELMLNFNVFMIPVGLGLLKGRQSSRKWAKFWIGLWVGGAGLVLIAYPFVGSSFSISGSSGEIHGGLRHAIVIGILLLVLIPGVIMWRLLSAPSVQWFFDASKSFVPTQKRAEPGARANPDSAPRE